MDTTKKDPLVQFFRRNIVPIFVVALVAVGGILGQEYYSNQRLKSRVEASEVFETMREKYSDWTTAQGSSTSVQKQEAEIAQTAFVGINKLLQDSSVGSYRSVGEIYDLLALVQSGKQTELAKISYQPVPARNAYDIERAFFPELRGFVIAKGLLDSAEHREKGKTILKGLVENGVVLSASALSSLASIASDQEDVKAVKELASNLRERQPFQAKSIDEIINELEGKAL